MTTLKQDWRMSATCIQAFKACATRFRLGYVEGLRIAEQTEALRIGTNWHACLEIAKLQPGQVCICFAESLDTLADPKCPICGGVGSVPDNDPLERVTEWLNHAYATVPVGTDPTAWAVERTILAYSVAGWLWYFGAENHTIATEIPFDLPLRNPSSDRALPHVRRVGKLDRLEREGNRVLLGEYKSTSSPIDSGSPYWGRLNIDSQISTYLAAVREMQLSDGLVDHGIGPDDPLISGVLYNVWHKPAIRPKKLTQAETKKFLLDNGTCGEYCGQKFITGWDAVNLAEGVPTVDGEPAEVTHGVTPKPTKKNPNPDTPFAIRETPDMFGARLLQSIQEEPEKHFAQREIARTDEELRDFDWQMYHMYQTMRSMNKAGHWWMNENQCDATGTFRCPYTSICHNRLDVYDGETTPPGFRRIFDDIETPVMEEEE
jgi:hypothetical protein